LAEAPLLGAERMLHAAGIVASGFLRERRRCFSMDEEGYRSFAQGRAATLEARMPQPMPGAMAEHVFQLHMDTSRSRLESQSTIALRAHLKLLGPRSGCTMRLLKRSRAPLVAPRCKDRLASYASASSACSFASALEKTGVPAVPSAPRNLF